MNVRVLIDDIRAFATEAGFKMSMAKERDLVARLLFGRPYSAACAAARASKLALPCLDNSRISELRAAHGPRVDILVGEAKKVLGGSTTFGKALLMTATFAIASLRLPPLPTLLLSDIERFQQAATKNGWQLHWVTLNPGNLYQGTYLQFVRTEAEWHALEDHIAPDGNAVVTAQFNGTIFRCRDMDDGEGTHHFLAWTFEQGKWELNFIEHIMAFDEELGCTREQLIENGEVGPDWLVAD